MGFPTQENREIRLSGGRENDLVPSTVARWYDFREPGGYVGNVGLTIFPILQINIETVGILYTYFLIYICIDVSY